MRDLVSLMLIVGITMSIYQYIYKPYEHRKEVCAENVRLDDVAGIIPYYYVAIGDEWKGDLKTGDYEESDKLLLKAKFENKDDAVQHCTLYFGTFNRQ